MFRGVIPIAFLLIAGCDRLSGVASRAAFTGEVDIGCVESALGSVPGLGTVTYHRRESRSTEVYPKQREVLTVTHLWLYGERGKSSLQINQTPDGWEFTNTRVRMGSSLPEDEISRFVPLMLLVNKTLASHCRLPVGNLQPDRF